MRDSVYWYGTLCVVRLSVHGHLRCVIGREGRLEAHGGYRVPSGMRGVCVRAWHESEKGETKLGHQNTCVLRALSWGVGSKGGEGGN